MANLIIKVSLIVGAGIAGSIMTRGVSVSDVLSGASKFFKASELNKSPASANKSNEAQLLDQIDNLRKELKLVASNRAVTIVTGGGTGTQKCGLIIIVGVVGYGYIWWKGYKLPDMMFATRRGLSDACNVVAKQLDGVNSMVTVTKRALNSKINGLDRTLKEIGDITDTTQNEVTQLHDRSTEINENVQSVRYAVQTLESKISSLEQKQDGASVGIDRLISDTKKSKGRLLPTNVIETLPSISPKLALEAPHPSRSASLPVAALPPSPDDSYGTPKVQQSPRHVASASGLKELDEPASTPKTANENKTSGLGILGGFFSGSSVSFRTRNATNAVPQQMPARNGGLQQDQP